MKQKPFCLFRVIDRGPAPFFCINLPSYVHRIYHLLSGLKLNDRFCSLREVGAFWVALVLATISRLRRMEGLSFPPSSRWHYGAIRVHQASDPLAGEYWVLKGISVAV